MEIRIVIDISSKIPYEYLVRRLIKDEGEWLETKSLTFRRKDLLMLALGGLILHLYEKPIIGLPPEPE